jgi:hypothetical protein
MESPGFPGRFSEPVPVGVLTGWGQSPQGRSTAYGISELSDLGDGIWVLLRQRTSARTYERTWSRSVLDDLDHHLGLPTRVTEPQAPLRWAIESQPVDLLWYCSTDMPAVAASFVYDRHAIDLAATCLDLNQAIGVLYPRPRG